MKKQLITALGTMMTALTFGSGCLVVTDNDYDNDGCYQQCQDYEVCQTYCDAWECWDECWYETTCDVSCPTPDPAVDLVDCIDDLDCSGDDICVADRCVQQDQEAKKNADAGLCQACESTNDCSEEDARCVRLNYEHSTKTGEKICSRVCELDDDCPIGFECVNISDEVGVPAQCLPKIDPANGDLRTCTNNASLECVKAKECGVGESCVNNVCTRPGTSTGSGSGSTDVCSSDSDCAAGESCRGSSCVAQDAEECIDRSQCASGEICVDAKCVAEKVSCVFNSECDGGKCVNGECTASCADSTECGPYEYCRKSEGASQGLCEMAECRRTADCDAGNICVEAQCKPACSTDSDCGTGYECNSNRYCDRDSSVECLSTSECSANEICVDNACAEACACNQDCADGLVCDLNSGTCGQPATNDAIITCANSCECPSGKTCSDQGVCE